METELELSDVFDVCSDCDTPVVELQSHSCPTEDTTKPRREERLKRAQADTRPDSETVLVTPTRARKGSSYAYHELGENGMPKCGGSGGTIQEDYRRVSREQAKKRNRCPCRSCQQSSSQSSE